MNKVSKYLIIAGLVFLGSTVISRTAAAQTHAVVRPEVDEDHADAAMKWLEGFTNPMHEANYYETRAKAYDSFRKMDNSPAMKALSSAAWVEVGKSQDGNVSGRTSCIAFTESGTIYLGAISGGLWKSTDNGANWVSMSETWKSLIIGGVAVDPQHQNVVYCGTGAPESFVGGAGALSGVGIYKSVDGGLNWELLSASPKAAICQVEVNWGNTNIVYCATTGGVSISSDSGHTWPASQSVSLGGETSIALDPNNAGIIYAAGGGLIKKSIDSGKTWTSLSGYPTGYLMTLGMSNVSSDSIYLSTGNGVAQNSTGSVVGASVIALSTDSGTTWTTVSQNLNYLGSQAYYANALAVNPTNPATVVVGGLDIYSSTKAGANLSKKTEWTAPNNSSNYAHADIHGLKYNPYTKQLFALTDGGVYHSETNGLSWSQDMNADLGTMLFVGGDMSADGNGEPVFFAAGAQDNGTNTLSPGTATYNMVLQGDGGTAYVSPTDGETMYGTYVNATLYRSVSGGSDWQQGQNTQNILGGTPISNANPPFYIEYDVCDQNADVVAVCGSNSYNDGGGNLYLSKDGGQNSPDDFPQVTNVGANTAVPGSVTTVHIAKNNESYIFLGTSNSKMYYSLDQGQTWTVSKSPSSLGGWPTSITSDPNDETHLFMTVSGTASKHFYVSTDTGHTWTAPSSTTYLPNGVNYRRVAYDGNGNIFVGHDFGVLRSQDGGVTWYNVADGFPYAMVTSLRVRGHYLVAASYGRGMFYIDINQLPAISSVALTTASNTGGVQINDIYPSILTASSARLNVDYSLSDDTHATLTVYDVLGREERVLANEYSSKGNHLIVADLSGLTSGQHYLVLTADGFSVTKPLTIE